MSNKSKFAELKKKMEEAKKEMKALAKSTFKDMSKEVFDKHPNLVSFSWPQYTPYFNDGDPCYFRARTDEPDMEFKINGETETIEGWDIPDNDEVVNASEDISKFLAIFDDDDLEVMFGDHARVTVSRDGVDVDEYDHD